MIGAHTPEDAMRDHFVSAAGLLLELAGVDEAAPKVHALAVLAIRGRVKR